MTSKEWNEQSGYTEKETMPCCMYCKFAALDTDYWYECQKMRDDGVPEYNPDTEEGGWQVCATDVCDLFEED